MGSQIDDEDDEIITARRTESLDAPHIIKLVEPWTEKLFGRVNVVNVIEKAVLAITLCNKDEEIMGHGAFLDYPNLPNVDQAKWEEWYNSKYQAGQVSSLNALFLHYFVSKSDYAMGCANEIIRTAFNAVPDLHFLFLAVPVGVFPDPSLAQAFRPMEKSESGQSDEHTLFVCRRHDHVPVLHIRKAFVEDHDDLTPIFNQQSDMLHNTYGDCFLAELIEAQDTDMQCLVAEVEKTSYGFMSISTDVNFDALNECFELGPFNGLKKPHADDVARPLPTPPATPPPQAADQASVADDDAASVGSKAGGVVAGEGGPAGGGEVAPEGSTKGSKHSSKHSSRGSRLKSKDMPAGPAESLVKVEHRLSDAASPGAASQASQRSGSTRDEAEAIAGRASSEPPTSETPKELIIPSQKRFVPTWCGEPNAFSIQLFCIAEQYEMRSCDFLVKAFSKFPDRDFCIITVPHMVPEFPLIQNFVRVTPKVPSVLSQELYVFHRSGLLKNFNVRPACSSDTEAINKLVENIWMKEKLLEDLAQFNAARRDRDGTEIQAFVAECCKQVVGISIIRREEEIEYLRSHFNIEDFIYFNHHRREDHGHLHHFVLNPVFQHLTKHFFKEILRLAHKTCLHYPLYPPYTAKDALGQHSLISSLNTLVPVRARRQIAYPKTGLGVNGPSDRILKELSPYALNHINRKLVLEPKVTVNARIVVVGASDVGVAFLETLVYCPHLRFNNVTLISPHGLPGDLHSDELRDSVLASSYCYNQSDYARMALRTWVNVVYGKMTSLDRTTKEVTVNGGAIVPYDHLVLCTGKQYVVPKPRMAGNDGVPLPLIPNARFMGAIPKNLYLINDQYEAAVMLYRIETHGKTEGAYPNMAVFGATLDAYTCMASLLRMGVPGAKIKHFLPTQEPEAVSCFNNPAIEEVVRQRLAAAGVVTHTDASLVHWNDGKVDDGDEIEYLSFVTSTGVLRMECEAFFCFHTKEVDTEAFKAINCACLVYDGRLVINASFHTNDVSVRAAGPLTKFQRKYHCEPWCHAHFNSKEVGIALASEMLRLFDPTLEPQHEPPAEPLNLIPIYRAPNVTKALLPGDLHYFHVAKPALPVPLAAQTRQPDYGRALETGTAAGAAGAQGYFRLHVNQYKSVETITCLAQTPFPSDNFLCLYGIHERMINNLISRFDEGLVKDLYSYLAEPWALAIFHDRFADFRDEIRELLITSPNDQGNTLEDLARKLVDEETGLSAVQRQELAQAYTASGSKRAVETRLLSFLSYNHYHLPFYAKPGMV